MKTENDIVNATLELLKTRAVVTVGVDGLGGAGKSTISENILDMLEAEGINGILLHIDDFINVRAIRYNSAYPEWQCYYELQWRYDHFRDIIERLKTVGNITKAELYDKDNDRYLTESYCTTERTALIVEGIFLQRRELENIFDLMTYIDVSEEERLKRVIKRDTYIGDASDIIAKYENRYFPAERKYFEEYRPDFKADIVIK